MRELASQGLSQKPTEELAQTVKTDFVRVRTWQLCKPLKNLFGRIRRKRLSVKNEIFADETKFPPCLLFHLHPLTLRTRSDSPSPAGPSSWPRVRAQACCSQVCRCASCMQHFFAFAWSGIIGKERTFDFSTCSELFRFFVFKSFVIIQGDKGDLPCWDILRS